LRVARALLMVGAMLRTRSLTIITAALLAFAACGGKKKAAEDKEAPPTEVAAPTTPPTPPPPPPPPVYSPEAAKAQIAKLGDCVIPDNCEPYKILVGFGPQVGPDVLAALGDAAVSKEAKRMAAEVIGALKLPDAGPRLIELASASDDHMLQSDLFEAAGASGGQATFDLLVAEYAKAIEDLDDDRDIPLRAGLRKFPAESIAWARAQFAKQGKAAPDQTGLADLFTDSAAAADLPAVVESLGKTKDAMARHRLAAKAIELGDTSHFAVFTAGLSSKDEYDRSDAANFLARVADKVPADQKAAFIELLQQAKAGDRGGLTSMGYDEALKKLGA
jgi:6,7-dimethyl-8-ribityllumazine synthase